MTIVNTHEFSKYSCVGFNNSSLFEIEPVYYSTQPDLNKWLRSTFVADSENTVK